MSGPLEACCKSTLLFMNPSYNLSNGPFHARLSVLYQKNKSSLECLVDKSGCELSVLYKITFNETA